MKANSKSEKEDKRILTSGIKLKSFSPDDFANKNPHIYRRLYETFKPMGIANDLDAINQYVADYSEWLVTYNSELNEEKTKAQEELQRLARKAGLKVEITDMH